MGIRFDLKIWTDYEEDIIREFYMTHTDRQISEKINRTKMAVTTRRVHLGLIKYNVYNSISVISINSIQDQIDSLVNFIETTNSLVWQEIANTKRKELIKLKNMNT